MSRAFITVILSCFLMAFGVVPAPAADQQTIVVVTSFPEELTTRYEREFERIRPDVHVQFVWKQSRDALAELTKPQQGGADIYWAPSPSNFALLRDRGAFRRLSVDRAALPGRLGAQQLSDPTGLYEAYDVAGYGIVANPGALAAAGLSAPRRWRDLASPEYARRMAMPVAGKVGFSPALYVWSLNRLSSVRPRRLIGVWYFIPPWGRCQLYLCIQTGSSSARWFDDA